MNPCACPWIPDFPSPTSQPAWPSPTAALHCSLVDRRQEGGLQSGGMEREAPGSLDPAPVPAGMRGSKDLVVITQSLPPAQGPLPSSGCSGHSWTAGWPWALGAHPSGRSGDTRRWCPADALQALGSGCKVCPSVRVVPCLGYGLQLEPLSVPLLLPFESKSLPGIPQPRAVSHGRSLPPSVHTGQGAAGAAASGLGHRLCHSAPRGWGQQSPPTRARPSALGATLHLPPSLPASVPFSLPPFSFLLSFSVLQTYLSCLLHPAVLFLPPPPPRAGPSTPCGLLPPYNTLNIVFWDCVGINMNVIFNPKSAPFSLLT